MEKNDFLLCCDWGTSSFRLRLVEMEGLKIIGEETSEEGINSVFNLWKTNDKFDKISRIDFFRKQLILQIKSLADKLSFDLQHIPLVISGMATSSIGMKDLPYASLPFSTDGKSAKVKFLEAQVNFPHELLLISGICSTSDVMRGEETQLVGLIEIFDNTAFSKETVFIFPGTHSKHIYVNNSQIVDFHTFITGEMFNLLSQHSLLKDSIENPQDLPFSNDEDLEGFIKGVGASGAANILNSLFTVRTNHLFGKFQKAQNFYYLSGVLIGAELRTLVRKNQLEVVLCSGKNLAQFYQNALEELNLLNRITFIKPVLVDQATIAGQVKMYQNLDKYKDQEK